MKGLQQRISEMNLPEDWHLELIQSRESTYYMFNFKFPGMPEVDEVDRYMHLNYAVVMPSQCPGVVQCDNVVVAHHFLDLVENHKGPIEYEKVLKFACMVHAEGWQDAIYPYVEEWMDELPAEGDGAPYWWTEDEFAGAELITTVSETNVYGSHHDISRPENNNTALLIAILAHDVGGEVEIEWHWCMEAVGIEEGSLEEFLALQLVCHNNTPYAYVKVDLIGGVWLLATPENLEFLESAQETGGFLCYYNEHEEIVKAWLDAIEEA